MPGSRTPLPHTALTLLLTAPLSCHPEEQDGEATDPQGCRTVILPADGSAPTTSSSSSSSDASTAADSDSTSGESTETTDSLPPGACGDGALDPGEACDDANTLPGDGCSPACARERHRVFVTSLTFPADLATPPVPGATGLARGDAQCRALASAAALPGAYRAWLSDSTSSPATRLGLAPDFPGIFERVDGALVAEGWGDLTDGTLAVPLSQDEYGNVLESDIVVWSNTDIDGNPKGTLNCLAWSTVLPTEYANVGHADATDSKWTSANTSKCHFEARLYCVQVSSPWEASPQT